MGTLLGTLDGTELFRIALHRLFRQAAELGVATCAMLR
jgi:hypothetical protein